MANVTAMERPTLAVVLISIAIHMVTDVPLGGVLRENPMARLERADERW
jgi:hypothetical protein